MKIKLLMAITTILACFSIATQAEDKKLPGNFSPVAAGIYRGEYLNAEEDYAGLARLGVKTVVNLRAIHHDDKELCRKYGLKCYDGGIFLNIPGNDKIFPWEKMAEIYQFVLKERATGRPVYFHCRYGKDRTGTLAAIIMTRVRACNQPFSKPELWTELNAKLDAHGFHNDSYPHLKQEVKDLVYSFETHRSWICDGKPFPSGYQFPENKDSAGK